MRKISKISLGILCFISALQAEITVRARFNPDKIMLGDIAEYIVEIIETSNTGVPAIERIDFFPVPTSNTLRIANRRIERSREIVLINGNQNASQTQRLIFEARAPQIGGQILSEYNFTYKGQNLTVPSTKLTVVERTADAGAPLGEMIFLKADFPESIYIGQTVPVKVKFYAASNIFKNLDKLRTIQGKYPDKLIFEVRGKSRGKKEQYKGKDYHVVTTNFWLTPILSGKQAIGFDLTGSLRKPDSELLSLFNLSNRKSFTIHTKPDFIDVKPLPDNPPASFSGAIGNFNLQTSTDFQETRVGEPIVLSVNIEGTGNFRRIQAPPLPESSDWKIHETASQYKRADLFKLQRGKQKGKKRFDYILVPKKPGKLELPPVRFAFLDPTTEEYVELDSPPLTVQVAPAYFNQATAPAVSDSTKQSSEDDLDGLNRAVPPEEALLALNYRPKNARQLESSLSRSRSFYYAQAGLFLSSVAFGLWLSQRRRRQKNPRYLLIRQAEWELKRARRAASSTQDATRFHFHAQEACRLAATRKVGRNFRNAGHQDIADLIKKDEAKEALAALFASADAHRFSQQEHDTDFSTARRQLKTVLKAL